MAQECEILTRPTLQNLHVVQYINVTMFIWVLRIAHMCSGKIYINSYYLRIVEGPQM